MQEFLNPEQVLDKLKLREDMAAAVDFGCGSGGWVLPLAKMLPRARVYAIDILEEPLSVLLSKAEAQKISNIQVILHDVEDKNNSGLSDESIDLVLITNLLFQVEDRKAVMEEAKRILKKGGQLLIVDWKKDAVLGPEEKVSIEEIKQTAEELDLKIKKEFQAGPYHWALILLK